MNGLSIIALLLALLAIMKNFGETEPVVVALIGVIVALVGISDAIADHSRETR